MPARRVVSVYCRNDVDLDAAGIGKIDSGVIQYLAERKISVRRYTANGSGITEMHVENGSPDHILELMHEYANNGHGAGRMQKRLSDF